MASLPLLDIIAYPVHFSFAFTVRHFFIIYMYTIIFLLISKISFPPRHIIFRIKRCFMPSIVSKVFFAKRFIWNF